MSRSLEQIVRPFQAGDVFTRAKLPPIPETPTIVIPEDVVKTWEGKADTDFNDLGEAWVNSFESDLKEDKGRRQSRTVKVVDQENPDNKIFVERIDKSVFKDSKGKELSLSFDWSAPKDGGT